MAGGSLKLTRMMAVLCIAAMARPMVLPFVANRLWSCGAEAYVTAYLMSLEPRGVIRT